MMHVPPFDTFSYAYIDKIEFIVAATANARFRLNKGESQGIHVVCAIEEC